MRLLLIDDDPDFRRKLRYHVGVEWPSAIFDEHSPSGAGWAAEDLALDDYDAVLLGHPLGNEAGFERLAALAARPGCPPIVVFADPSDEFLAVDALKAGAASYFPKHDLRHARLIAVLRDAFASRAGARSKASSSEHAGTAAKAVDARTASGATAALDLTIGSGHAGTRRYRFLERLHATDLSTVYLAEDVASGARVVCKVVQHAPGPAGTRLFERFVLEYQAIAAVRHPHVVRILDVGAADDHAYIVMEHFAGGSLADRLAKGPLDPARAVDYARQIGAALDAIHSVGILHRDLKPGNVMFREDDTLALIDFGLAKQLRLDASLTSTGQIFGTPHYMSPEQGRARPVDERSDLYSLGCILFEMLTGRKPFTAGTAMGVIYKHAHSPRPRLEAEHAAFEPLLERLLAISPDDRFASAAEWLRALDETFPASSNDAQMNSTP